MKKLLAITLSLLCVLSLFGCSKPQKEENQTMVDPAADNAAYKSVLLENGQFVSTDLDGKKIDLSGVRQVVFDDENITITPSKFVVMDLDGDMQDEVVVWLDVDGGMTSVFEILKYLDGEVYGYTLWYRAFIGLKTDGTFSYSGGAADSGVGKLVLKKDGYTMNKISYSESRLEDSGVIVDYFVDSKKSTEAEFLDAFEKHLDKDDVTWIPLSAEHVNASL